MTAHEVAHQWWGYQVLGADVQGANMLSETMAQYSALMVMQQEYGADKMRRFLRYELDRYLSGRGGELVEEVPLELVEDQGYIHYSKGSLALYALQDAIGEARLNEALRGYVASVRFQPPPYTVSTELVAAVAKVTPPERRQLLDRFVCVHHAVRQPGDLRCRAPAPRWTLRRDGDGEGQKTPRGWQRR